MGDKRWVSALLFCLLSVFEFVLVFVRVLVSGDGTRRASRLAAPTQRQDARPGSIFTTLALGECLD